VRGVNKHAPNARLAANRAFVGNHRRGGTVPPFGAWGWGGWGYNYPDVAIAAPEQPAIQPAFAQPNPEALPPCHETQVGVTIIRGKSCRA
jgi:hypothetical protein